jgi:hypothetical protein
VSTPSCQRGLLPPRSITSSHPPSYTGECCAPTSWVAFISMCSVLAWWLLDVHCIQYTTLRADHMQPAHCNSANALCPAPVVYCSWHTSNTHWCCILLACIPEQGSTLGSSSVQGPAINGFLTGALWQCLCVLHECGGPAGGLVTSGGVLNTDLQNCVPLDGSVAVLEGGEPQSLGHQPLPGSVASMHHSSLLTRNPKHHMRNGFVRPVPWIMLPTSDTQRNNKHAAMTPAELAHESPLS